MSRDPKGSPKGCTVDTRAVFESALLKAVTDLCPKMMVGERLGDTFISNRTDAACCVRSDLRGGFKEEGGGETLGI